MKKSLILLTVFLLAVTAFAGWRQHSVAISTNLTTVTLDERFAEPAELYGYYAYPAPAVFTNNVTNTVYLWYYPADYPYNTEKHQVHTGSRTSGVPLIVKDLGLIVRQGDTLVYSNSVYPGRVLFNYKTE